MARSGWSASNILRLGSAVISSTPISMAAWCNSTSAATQQVVLAVLNSASTALNYYALRLSPVGGVGGQVADGVSNNAFNNGTITANTWFHAGCTFANGTDIASYLNGVGSSNTFGTSRTPTGLNRTSIGLRDDVSADLPFLGQIAEAAIWNVTLTAADYLMLSAGVSPLSVRPSALVAYWPILGNNSPETNYKSNASVLSVVGSLTKTAHPRIIRPHHRQY